MRAVPASSCPTAAQPTEARPAAARADAPVRQCMRENGVRTSRTRTPTAASASGRRQARIDPGDPAFMKAATARSAGQTRPQLATSSAVTGGQPTRAAARRRHRGGGGRCWSPPWASVAAVRLRRRPPTGPRRGRQRTTGDRHGHPADPRRHGDRGRRAGLRRDRAPARRAQRHASPSCRRPARRSQRGKPLYRVDNKPVVLLYGGAARVPDPAAGRRGRRRHAVRARTSSARATPASPSTTSTPSPPPTPSGTGRRTWA